MIEVTVTVEPVEHPVTVNIDETVTNVVVNATENVTEVTVFVGGRVVIKRTDNSVIATVDGPEDYIVQDSTVVNKNTQGTTINTASVMADSSVDNELPDEDYVINVNGVEVDSGSFPVYGNVTIDIDL